MDRVEAGEVEGREMWKAQTGRRFLGENENVCPSHVTSKVTKTDLAALLDLELLDEAVRFFLVRSRPRSFLASADRTRLGLAALRETATFGPDLQKRQVASLYT